MGITQHRNAVATIREVANLALMRGSIGRPGAGLCPVRGHSNVQGDRPMGIYEKPPPALLDALAAEFGFAPPPDDGRAHLDTLRGLRAGHVRHLLPMGGHFAGDPPPPRTTPTPPPP